MEQDKQDEVTKTLLSLNEKYENNSYVLNKIHNYIVHLLPGYLELNNENHKQREKRKQILTTGTEKFINSFMGKNKFFYNNQTEFFFLYDGEHYSIYNEDDIVYKILTTISQEKSLMSWKQKIKNNIICKIRENSILKSIPESYTIQNVIQELYPKYFSTKNEAKYFLTIIGDNLLKKNENIIYFISPRIKFILKEISNKAFATLGQANSINNLKYKYYDHNYSDCRLITINKVNEQSNQKLTNTLNLLCVAAHYSERYKNADNFLRTYCDYEMIQHSLYLTNNNSEKIVDDFIRTSLQTSKFVSIEMKNIFFLWKKFLEQKNIPNVLFNNPLKQLLKTKLKYNEETDAFMDVTSIHLPIVSNFLNFWDENIIQEHDDLEYEIDEICTLFKHWSRKHKYKQYCSMNEELILDLIQHFYPDIVIENKKFILHIGCKLWDKNSDIFNSINHFREKCIQDKECENQSLYDLYKFYCNQYTNSNINSICIASKKYFDKFVSTYLKDMLDKEHIISTIWFQN